MGQIVGIILIDISQKNTNAIEFHLYDKDKNEKYKSEIERVKKEEMDQTGYSPKKEKLKIIFLKIDRGRI